MPGFDFSNYNRNAALHAKGVPLPKATSTGTTIVGCIYDNGVVVCCHCFRNNLEITALREADLTVTVTADCSRYQSYQRPYSSRQGMRKWIQFFYPFNDTFRS